MEVNDKLIVENCITCGEPIALPAFYIRLNNHGLPNGPTDKWGQKHQACASEDDLAELSGEKYFGKGWRNG